MSTSVAIIERPGERELAELEGEIARLAAHIHAATYRLLQLIHEFDERNGWTAGFRSCADWLVWRIGLSPVAAREKVRVAKALPELPLLSEALRKGEISYSKVRALTRIARPDTEADLLTIARAGTTAHVEKLVRSYRRVKATELTREEARHQRRHLQTYVDDDGMVVIRGRLAPEAGAALLKAIDGATEALRNAPSSSTEGAVGRDDGAPTDGETRAADDASPAQRRADALGLVAQSALAAEMQRGSAADHTQVVVHVDEAVLAEDAAEGESMLEPAIGVSAETSRRLSCDAALVRVQQRADGTVLDVGRKTRTIPPALRRALKSRDRTCQFPGCFRDRYLEGHHITHWARGGETKLSNLVHLCWAHHRDIHEGGFGLELDEAGELRFTLPSGWPLDGVPPPLAEPVSAETLVAEQEHLGLELDHDTLEVWKGEAMDYGWAVDSLLRADEANDGQQWVPAYTW